MPPPIPTSARATFVSILSAATVLVALSGCAGTPIAGIAVPAPPTTTQPATSPSTITPATTAPSPSPSRDRTAALATAKAWLAAYRSDQWTDTPTSWIDRVRPFVTSRMHTANLHVRDAAANHDWRAFVTSRCVSTVTDLDAVIPPEAPNTPTTLNIQAAGTVRTQCAASSLVAADKPAAATIVMTLTPTGWLVDQRLY